MFPGWFDRRTKGTFSGMQAVREPSGGIDRKTPSVQGNENSALDCGSPQGCKRKVHRNQISPPIHLETADFFRSAGTENTLATCSGVLQKGCKNREFQDKSRREPTPESGESPFLLKETGSCEPVGPAAVQDRTLHETLHPVEA